MIHSMSKAPFPEVNRELRGHHFYPTDAERASIPSLYETEDTPLDDKIAHARYFVRNGFGEWYIFELEQGEETRKLAFAMCDLGYRELGYVDLVALESLRVERPDGSVAIVERDLAWTPRSWFEVAE